MNKSDFGFDEESRAFIRKTKARVEKLKVEPEQLHKRLKSYEEVGFYNPSGSSFIRQTDLNHAGWFRRQNVP